MYLIRKYTIVLKRVSFLEPYQYFADDEENDDKDEEDATEGVEEGGRRADGDRHPC
jgi:hypothetical protein